MSVRLAVPGDRIADSSLTAGAGTYARGNGIYATLVGNIVQDTEGNRISVVSQKHGVSAPAVPYTGAIVVGHVKRLSRRAANIAIVLIDDKPVKVEFEGVIRQENIREFEVDKLQLHCCFRPGDIVRAQVISLGDAHSYLLSTSRNDLGVVLARSATGAAMVPISWTEMQCPETGAVEKRKVCQMQPE